MKHLLTLLTLPLLLASCGGITHYLHKDAGMPSAPLAPLTLKTGQQKLILKHTQGIAIVGGYKAGLTVGDGSIAQVRYGDGSQSDRFAPKAYLIGKKPGTTRAAYTNRLGPRNISAYPPAQTFQVTVE